MIKTRFGFPCRTQEAVLKGNFEIKSMTDLKGDLLVIAALKSTIGSPSTPGIHRLRLCGHDWASARVLGDDMLLVSVKRQ
jgi:hypothetical protein